MPKSKAIELSKRFYWKLLACTVAITLYFQFTQHGHMQPYSKENTPTTALVASFLSIILATIFRWVIIPRIKDKQKVFLSVAFGMAMSESVSFYGIFLLPSDMTHLKLGLFVISLLGIIQFAPVYIADENQKNGG